MKYADPARFGRLLCLLIEQKVEIRVEGGDIVANGPPEALTPALVSELRHFKRSLLKAFADAPFPSERA